MPLPRLALTLLCIGIAAAPAGAQFAPGSLPDLSALNGAIAGASGDPADDGPGADASQDGPIASGFTVPDTGARGTAARLFADGLREAGQAELAETMEAGMLEARDEAERVATSQGFAARDLGVAYALFFITSWEMANDSELPLPAAASAGRTLVAAMREGGESAVTGTPEDLDRAYDAFLTLAGGFVSLTRAYEEAGQAEEETAMRRSIAESFQQTVGVPPASVTITPDGEIVLPEGAILPN